MAVFIAQEECTVNVGKAWHYLLIHPEKGYYTGYKGLEAFGDLESARIYRTEQEAYMARLRAGMEVRVESCLLWHSSRPNNTEGKSAQVSHTTTRRSFRVINGCSLSNPRPTATHRGKTQNKPQTQLKLVKSS